MLEEATAYFLSIQESSSLCEKCPYSELFWSVFSPHFPTFGLNTVRMQENADQSNSKYGHLITQCLNICILNWIMELYHYNSIELWDFNWLSKHIEKIIPNHGFILTNFCTELRIHWRFVFGNVILCSTLRLWKIKYKKSLRIVASWGFKIWNKQGKWFNGNFQLLYFIILNHITKISITYFCH